MRYLTHESEDNFWTSHGAKPHPLAQAAEAEKKLQSPTAEESSSSGKMVKFSPQNEIKSLTSPVASSTSDSIFPSGGGLAPGDRGSHGSLDKPDDQDGQSSTSSSGSKRNYVHMTDDEIIKAQAHAARVGYKISTV